MKHKIKPLTIVKFVPPEGTLSLHIAMLEGQFKDELSDSGFLFLFIGEITNMPQHCVLIGMKSGRNYVGYHTDNFEVFLDDDTD